MGSTLTTTGYTDNTGSIEELTNQVSQLRKAQQQSDRQISTATIDALKRAFSSEILSGKKKLALSDMTAEVEHKPGKSSVVSINMTARRPHWWKHIIIAAAMDSGIAVQKLSTPWDYPIQLKIDSSFEGKLDTFANKVKAKLSLFVDTDTREPAERSYSETKPLWDTGVIYSGRGKYLIVPEQLVNFAGAVAAKRLMKTPEYKVVVYSGNKGSEIAESFEQTKAAGKAAKDDVRRIVLALSKLPSEERELLKQLLTKRQLEPISELIGKVKAQNSAV